VKSLSATTSETSRSVGSLVNARGRDWVVLPSQDPDLLRLRPLTGTEEEGIGVFLPLIILANIYGFIPGQALYFAQILDKRIKRAG
jgi:hypothetical protein